MKIHFLKKLRWCAFVLALTVIGAGCASKPQQPVTTAPESHEPGPLPTSPSTAPPQKESREPVPPSREPAPAPGLAPVTPSAETAPAPKESYFTHTVRWSGETVSIIAAWYTGNLENWKALAEVMAQNNPKANIHRIFLGNKILIPESLLKTRAPMPKEFVDSFYQKPGKDRSKPAASQTGEKETELYGPKQTPKK